MLTPILLSGGGRTGSTRIMSLLGTDPRVVFDRAFPYESRYLTYFAKFGRFLQRPDLFQFLSAEQMFSPSYLNFGGSAPPADYVPRFSEHVYLPRADFTTWVRELWEHFCRPIQQQDSNAAFYAEKVPEWLPAVLRPCMNCFTIYNFRDPRDVFISANAFIKKRNALGFGRAAGYSDRDHARRLAMAFLASFENYFADRHRKDTLLLRYEDLVLDQNAVLNKIRGVTGLEVNVDPEERYVGEHATAKDLKSSVERWKTQPLPDEINGFFETHLGEEMSLLGYSVADGYSGRTAGRISFAEGRIKLSRLKGSSDGRLAQQPDFAEAEVNGPDFNLALPVEPFAAQEIREIWISVKGDIGNQFSLYWRRRDTQFSESSVLHIAYRPGPQWSVLAFLVGNHPEWKGEITHLRLDLFNSLTTPHKGVGYIRWVQLVA